MLGLLIPTVSTWFNQGSLANQVNGTSSSNLTGASAAQSSITPTNGTQLANAFENLISQLNAATQAGGASATSTASSASGPGLQAANGRHHGGHVGGAALSALLQQLDELATGSSATGNTSSVSGSASTGSGSSSASTTPSVSAASATNIETTLNQLLQNLKLASGNTNVAALNSATAASSASSLTQRLAQQGVQARIGHLLRAVA